MRGRRGVLIASIAASAACAGCQWNTSSISLALSDERLVQRVGQRFSAGMDGDTVSSQLNACRLNWRIDRQMIQLHEYNPDIATSGIVARVEPHGVHWAFPYAPPSGELWFYFARGTADLHSVKWRRPRWTRGQGAGLHEPMDVPLGERS
jgi:hypothetical protein